MLTELLDCSSLPDAIAHRYGDQLLRFSGTLPDGLQLGLLVWCQDPNAFVPVREELYRLTPNFKKGQFMDFGNVVGGSFGLSEVVGQLVQKGILPIVLTDQEPALASLLRGFDQQSDLLDISLIDSHLDLDLDGDWQQKAQPSTLEQLLSFYPQLLFHANCLGYQSYFVEERVLDYLVAQHHDAYRLGVLRAQLEEAEPVVRNSDVLFLQLSAIRAADAPATCFANPNGFLAEEACRIVRYAAMNDHLACLGIGGYRADIADNRQTARLLAQLVWFAAEGVQHRKNEYPLSAQRLTKYLVQSHWVDFPLTFFKSPRSERWWFWVPLPEGSRPALSRHQLVACSYADYQKACEGELPQRLLDAYRRFE